MATRSGAVFALQGAAVTGKAPTQLPIPGFPGRFYNVSPFYYDQVTVAETALTINFLLLPPGKIEIYPTLSRLIADQGVATADLSLGHPAYVDAATGLTVAADLVKWASAIDVGGAAQDVAWAGTDPQAFNTAAGLTIQGLYAVANIDADDEVQGWVVWTRVD